jgi:hypothetical protein
MEDVLCAGSEAAPIARVEAAGVTRRGLAGQAPEGGLENRMSIDILRVNHPRGRRAAGLFLIGEQGLCPIFCGCPLANTCAKAGLRSRAAAVVREVVTERA